MAIAKFHSFRGEKSALIIVKANAFASNSSAVYVPKTALPSQELAEGAEFFIPDGYSVVDMVDTATGEVRCAKDGSHLKVLHY